MTIRFSFIVCQPAVRHAAVPVAPLAGMESMGETTRVETSAGRLRLDIFHVTQLGVIMPAVTVESVALRFSF